jgi:hypothetical protein
MRTVHDEVDDGVADRHLVDDLVPTADGTWLVISKEPLSYRSSTISNRSRRCSAVGAAGEIEPVAFGQGEAVGLALAIWRPANLDWPEAYAILTVETNPDVAPYHDRQMAVLRREQRLAWLDSWPRGTCCCAR